MEAGNRILPSRALFHVRLFQKYPDLCWMQRSFSRVQLSHSFMQSRFLSIQRCPIIEDFLRPETLSTERESSLESQWNHERRSARRTALLIRLTCSSWECAPNHDLLKREQPPISSVKKMGDLTDMHKARIGVLTFQQTKRDIQFSPVSAANFSRSSHLAERTLGTGHDGEHCSL
jgi:hypothetical protein